MSIDIGGKTVKKLCIGWYAQAVDYIQSSGTQYIDTGFIPNQNTKVDMDALWTTNGKYPHLFGARVSASSGMFGLYYSGGSASIMFSYNATKAKANVTQPSVKANYKVDKNKFYLNGVLKLTATQATFEPGFSLFLLSRNQSGTAGENAYASIYACKVYDNNTLVRDFVPCVLICDLPASLDSASTARESGTVGLWDEVEGKFYANAGTGVFTYDNLQSEFFGGREVETLATGGKRFYSK